MNKVIAVIFLLLAGVCSAGTLSRLYDFQPGDIIYSAEVDDEFNQIVQLLNGTSTTKYASIKNSHATDPVLRVNQAGAGPVFEAQVSGTTKVSVNNSGQLVSALATGTAPFSVSSTTVVTNLNADKLDGYDASSFITSASPVFTTSLEVSGTNPTITMTDTTAAQDDWQFSLDNSILVLKPVGGSSVLTLNNTLATADITFPLTITNADPYLAFTETDANADDVYFDNDADQFSFTNSTTGSLIWYSQLGTAAQENNVRFKKTVGYDQDAESIASNGVGTPAAATINPASSFVAVTCNDADGCNVTLDDTTAYTGEKVTFMNVSANTVNFADTSGVSETAGAFAAGQWDTISFIFYSDRWVETGRSNN